MQYIRPWTLDDAGNLAAALNNKKVQDNLRDGIPFPYTEQDAAAFIRSALDAPAHSQYSFAIHWDQKAVGSIGIYRGGNIHSRTAEMGYYVAEPYWGRGLTTGAVMEACRYVLEHTDILRIYAEPFAGNTASCRVLEKAGFQLEGVLRKNAVKNGAVRDMRMYALVRESDGKGEGSRWI